MLVKKDDSECKVFLYICKVWVYNERKKVQTEEDTMNGWIDTRNHEPTSDGTYLVQMTYGGLSGLDFTTAGGWNTHYDTHGELHTESAISKLNVARWLDAPEPPEVPDEWWKELMSSM